MPVEAWPSGDGGQGPKHSRTRDRKEVSFRYDLSNDFFRVWLDSDRVHPGTYFESRQATLESAQSCGSTTH